MDFIFKRGAYLLKISLLGAQKHQPQHEQDNYHHHDRRKIIWLHFFSDVLDIQHFRHFFQLTVTQLY